MGSAFFNVGQYSLVCAVSQRLSRSPRIALVLRYALPLLAVLGVTEAVHHTSPGQPASGILSMGVVLLSAWAGGLGPSLLLTPLLFIVSRLHREPSERWVAVTSQELLAITIIALLSAALGLVGQYRRRMRAVTRQHALELRDQARALQHASILFREFDGPITQWNEGTERLFGWTRDEAMGRVAAELLQSQFSQPLEAIQQELMRTGQWHGEAVHRHKSGSELHVATHWILYRNKSGEPIGVVEVHNDVTQLRRAEAAIREADRRKDEFIAVLAHELRNPLAPIRTGLELMRTVKDDPALIEKTRSVMERQVCQLVSLVDDLLDVSRISRGQMPLRKSTVALADIVESAVETAKPMIEASRHLLRVTLPDTPVLMQADPNRLAQVLSNLLDNAAKYTNPGGQIFLTGQCIGHEVIVTIKDNGKGIPADMLGRIFEMFTRSESSGTVHAGLGIGLALVKSIVERHGGRIEVRSEGPGTGSEFRVALPLLSQTLILDPAQSVERRPAPASSPVLIGSPASAESRMSISTPVSLVTPSPVDSAVHACGRRVLIVDDNVAAATLLSVLVKNNGDDVRVAHDGQQAIEVARAFNPEVILMDLGMPKLDGYGACRYIRQQPWGRNMLLIALTGWGQDGHRQRTKEAGFDHHLVKPADPAELKRLLTDVRS